MRRNVTPKPIWIKFGTVVDIRNIITDTNFGDHRLRGFWVAGVKFPSFIFQTFIVVLTTLSHYRASVWFVESRSSLSMRWYLSFLSSHGRHLVCDGIFHFRPIDIVNIPPLNRAYLSTKPTSTLPRTGLYTVSQKSEPPKHFATATANLHRFKWNFTHTRRHLFLSSTSNFLRISYSVYEMFNSFKLLSQISVTDTTYFLLTSSVVTGMTSVRVDKQTTCYQKRIEF